MVSDQTSFSKVEGRPRTISTSENNSESCIGGCAAGRLALIYVFVSTSYFQNDILIKKLPYKEIISNQLISQLPNLCIRE